MYTKVIVMGYGHFNDVKRVLLSVVTIITIQNQIGTQIIISPNILRFNETLLILPFFNRIMYS